MVAFLFGYVYTTLWGWQGIIVVIICKIINCIYTIENLYNNQFRNLSIKKPLLF